jgi:hypothetical protein
MNRPVYKRAGLAAISLLLLLYYNVMWAVLRCPHQEKHADHEVVLYDTGSYAVIVALSSTSHGHVDDCNSPKYRRELLAGPLTNSEHLRLTRVVASHEDVFFGSPGLVLDQIEAARLIALSKKGSSAASQVGLPRYLSLSVFRF